MPNKSFSIYNSANEDAVDTGSLLTIEIAKSHIACFVTKESGRSIEAFEFFTFPEDEQSDPETLFTHISDQSKIINNPFSSAIVYINHEVCVPVPIFKFNKEIAAEYLNIVFGEDHLSNIQYEHLPVEQGIMNVYRVKKEWFNYLQQRFKKVAFHHTYSNIIRRLISNTSGFSEEFISIQFYNTFIIAVVMKQGDLQLIQTFYYETPEDVLYILLDIAQQFRLYSDALTIQIAGMIDLDFKLYRELITYFKNVVVEYVKQPGLSTATEHPQHYFTPFFNLAQ